MFFFGKRTLRGTIPCAPRGQIVPIVALALVALLGMTTLAVDVGYWRYQQRLEQSAADAAAVAGAIRLYYPTTVTAGTAPAEVKASAQNASADNGFTDDAGVGNLTVTVNSPPLLSAGVYAANTAAQVIVRKKQPVFFAGVLGNASQFVSATAVAARVTDGSGCFYQLDSSSSIDLNAGDVTLTNCGIVSNGQVSVHGTITANSLLWYGTAPSYGSLVNTGGTAVTPKQMQLPATDPCFKIQGCAYIKSQPIPSSALAVSVSGTTTLTAPAEPAYLVIKNCCASNTLFNPGLYYVYGGISGAIHGSGVTLVNVDGGITVNGQGRGTPDITAPSTFGPPDNAPTAGVAYYQPPGNSSTITYNGTPTVWDGLFYAPSAHITSNGQPDSYTSLIIGGIQIHGNKALTVDPALTPGLGVSTAQDTTHVVLSE